MARPEELVRRRNPQLISHFPINLGKYYVIIKQAKAASWRFT